MIGRIRAFGAFWYGFIIGDDWRVAVGVAVSLALTWWVRRTSEVSAWWIVPAAVVLLLGLSVHRTTRTSRANRPPP